MNKATVFGALALMCFLPSASQAGGRELTFEDRVKAQEAIERLYYSHQIGASLPFEQAVPREVLETKVRLYLKESAALARFWNTRITQEALGRELDRMQRQTRMPRRLSDLFAALGSDPFVIRECLVRPVLVDRLARNFFASDERIHTVTKKSWNDWWSSIERSLDETSAARRSAVDPATDIMRRGRNTASSNTRAGLAGGVIEQAWATPPPLDEDSSGASMPAASPWSASSGADDTWNNGVLDDMPVPRSNHPAVWTGSLMIIWGGGESARQNGARYDPTTDSWTRMSTDGEPAARFYHTAVWTGSAVIVWGGSGCCSGSPFKTGGRYDPVADTWSPTSTLGAPTGRSHHTAVWTGSQMIIWGGHTYGPPFPPPPSTTELNSGSGYDPVADTWTPIPMSTAPIARHEHTAVWTGSEMIVWGGRTSSFSLGANTGGRYNPATGTWATLPTTNAPSARARHRTVWTGTRMLIWGGQERTGGGSYDPLSNSWSTLSTVNAPPAYDGQSAVWTGSEMIVWGGLAYPGLNTGRRYDPITNTWQAIATLNNPGSRQYHSAVWTGTSMIIWGGGGGQDTNTGGRYDLSSDTWTPTSTGPGPTPRTDHCAVWTGNLMVIWGGAGSSYSVEGGAYDPVVDAWRSVSTQNQPTPRRYAAAVWSGSRMIVWGGQESSYANGSEGGLYDPIRDAWAPTSLVNAPYGREFPAAVWTGTEMVVWGGRVGAGEVDTGGRYDPLLDSWRPTTGVGAPAARSSHRAVWTGRRMIVWGGERYGYPDYTQINTGGVYDPVSDTWTPTSMMSPPSARARFSAIWTGSHMIVFGGANNLEVKRTGFKYDPLTDSWTQISSGSPPGKASHSAVWTGDAMLVWSGDYPDYSPGGERYDVAQDSWTPMSSVNAPADRKDHTAIWTGEEMIVWGGTAYGPMNAGGRYSYEPRCSVSTWYADADGDGYGLTTAPVLSCVQPVGYAGLGGDCDDRNAAIHPGAAETCNGVDEDCNGLADDGGDSLCDDGSPCTDDSCEGSGGCVFDANDALCDDSNACTVGDRCALGACRPGRPLVPKIDCNDGNLCTRDECDPDTGCIHTPRFCHDGDPGTIDTCDPSRGCIYRMSLDAP